MKTECTFTPNTNKKPFAKKVAQQIQSDDRTSVGSINLDGIAKKRDNTDDVFEQASSLKKSVITSEAVKGKHDELYSMRKRQMDKTDKTREDYEFERQG